ncbi:MAG: hypothetical protein ACHQUC_08855 [Chlamydiales bacterium]
MDRGYWYQLQIAANTTMPYENQNLVTEGKSMQVETAQERWKLHKNKEQV